LKTEDCRLKIDGLAIMDWWPNRQFILIGNPF
jgi:hypothetical protein